MTIQSVILRPYVNGVLSEDGWDIAQICEIAPVPHRLYEEKRLFAVSNDYMFVCLKLYDSVDELNTSILEHDEFLLQIETDTVLITFDHLTDATIYLADDNYQRLFFAAPRRYIKKKTKKQTIKTRTMKEIKVQLRHAKIDAPLECTMRVCDDEFFIENENFPPIEIENTRFVPVEESMYAIIRSFLSLHKEEWNLLVERCGFRKNLPPIYEKIRQNNVREWQQERLSKQQNHQQ